MASYKELDAWQRGMQLVEECYQLTLAFPTSERFGLVDQLRRAAVSIPSNVAEGQCRQSDGAFRNHVSIALGSHGELETCIELAKRLRFIDAASTAAIEALTATVGRLLNGLHRSLASAHDQRRSRIR